jgi:hypothetical protein
VVENDVNRGDEGVPQSAEPAYPAAPVIEIRTNKGFANGYAPLDAAGKVPVNHLPGGILIDPSITSLAGGSSSSLASIASSTLPVSRVLGIVVNGTLVFYQLQAGSEAQALPGVVRPSDFNSSTNARIWKQVL